MLGFTLGILGLDGFCLVFRPSLPIRLLILKVGDLLGDHFTFHGCFAHLLVGDNPLHVLYREVLARFQKHLKFRNR